MTAIDGGITVKGPLPTVIICEALSAMVCGGGSSLMQTLSSILVHFPLRPP